MVGVLTRNPSRCRARRCTPIFVSKQAPGAAQAWSTVAPAQVYSSQCRLPSSCITWALRRSVLLLTCPWVPTCCQQVLLYAQLRGNNQGIIKITTGGMNRSAAAGPILVERETRLSALINGNNQAGMLVLHRAMTMAVEKAKSAGFGIVGTNHTCTSTGALGFYAEQVAKQGLIGIVLAQSPEFVAPHGAKQAVFGTNPIAIGIPAEQGPVVMDMATAAYAWFGLLEAKTAGRPIPGDVALNAQGQPTTDPNEVLSGGAIRVFDRYKHRLRQLLRAVATCTQAAADGQVTTVWHRLAAAGQAPVCCRAHVPLATQHHS